MSAAGRRKSVFRCAATASTVSGGIVAEMCLTSVAERKLSEYLIYRWLRGGISLMDIGSPAPACLLAAWTRNGHAVDVPYPSPNKNKTKIVAHTAERQPPIGLRRPGYSVTKPSQYAKGYSYFRAEICLVVSNDQHDRIR